MTTGVDDSFLAWDRSQKRLAALLIDLQHAASQEPGEGERGRAAIAEEVMLLKTSTQELYDIALAAYRKQPARKKSAHASPLSRARRLA